ncbi:MAG: flagellar hook-basal body complex protein FliE [Rhodospirillaceae bacterium]|nr:flagellar hook-basal body complex protein FliE [Rhodospirillaceae bacterium]
MVSQVQNIANAAAAYAKAPGSQAASMDISGASKGPTFADMVKGTIHQAINTQQQSEAVSLAAINDRADITQVVTAVAEAEVTLQAVVAIRDKVIDAYREILRMPV